MRLKYLFFPIILILAVAVFFGYINPEIVAFKAVSDDYNTNLQILQGVKNKKAALDSLSNTIKNDEESNAMILNYLPKNKVEEKIVGEVNYLAANAGVFLDNVEIVDNPTPASVVADLASKNQPIDIIQNTQAVITVDGDYDKLKTFFNGIQHIPLFNSIKSLNIATVEKTTSSDSAATSTTGSQSTTTITAKITVDFGYLKQVKADDKKLADFHPEIDNATIQKLKDYTAGNVPKINMSGISAGSNNPFLSQ